MPNFHEFLCQKRQLINKQVNLERSYSSRAARGSTATYETASAGKSYIRFPRAPCTIVRIDGLTLSIYFRVRYGNCCESWFEAAAFLLWFSLLTTKFAMALFGWWSARLGYQARLDDCTLHMQDGKIIMNHIFYETLIKYSPLMWSFTKRTDVNQILNILVKPRSQHFLNYIRFMRQLTQLVLTRGQSKVYKLWVSALI